MRILCILVKGETILDVGMEREEEDATDVGGSRGSIGGRYTSVEFPGIGSIQATMLEDSPTLKFSDSLINF